MKPFKILIVSKFLYARGGAEVYSINLGEILQKQGHEVRFFSMSYPQNIHVNEDKYFAEEVSFFHSSISGRLKAALRVFGVGIKNGYENILDDFQPDVVHLNNIHSYLSPIVAKLAHKRGIKVVWTIHDYKLICPAYACLRKGVPCEICFNKKINVVSHKCMKNNILASFLAWWEAIYWKKEKLLQWTDAFICPSNFMAQKMTQGKYPINKLNVICNFVSEERARFISKIPSEEQEIAYAYVGRLSEEKGVDALLKAAIQLPYKLYIAGRGPLENYLQQNYVSPNIVFLGQLSAEAVIHLLKKVQFSIIPSICYENNPLGVIESLCCGTPVLGRNIGGIPELLKTNTYNRLFSKDEDLPIAITDMFTSSIQADRGAISTIACKSFSAGQYYQQWLKVIQNIS